MVPNNLSSHAMREKQDNSLEQGFLHSLPLPPTSLLLLPTNIHRTQTELFTRQEPHFRSLHFHCTSHSPSARTTELTLPEAFLNHTANRTLPPNLRPAICTNYLTHHFIIKFFLCPTHPEWCCAHSRHLCEDLF